MKKINAERYAELMATARQTNAERDELDHQHGFATPTECPIDVGVRTVMAAIETGIRMEDWACVAEAQAILESLQAKL